MLYSGRPRSDFTLLSCALVFPVLLLLLYLSVLLVFLGGHNHAYLLRNPHCTDATTAPSNAANRSTAPVVIAHISDIHVTDIDGGRAKRHATKFIRNVLPFWKPYLQSVLITGDLVNSIVKNPYPLGARSATENSEWSWLANFLEEINSTTPVYSVPGNHDSFGSHPFSSKTSCTIFGSCPAKPSDAKRRVRNVKKQDDSNVPNIFAIDATLSPPLHRPFNFFGDAEESQSELSALLVGLKNTKVPNIAFGHYPSSTMHRGLGIHAHTSDQNSIDKPHISAYLSGHLHTLWDFFGGGFQVVTRSGSFELELPDLKSTGVYRILVIEGASLYFKEFGLWSSPDSDSIQNSVVLNPPLAGFCNKGAGAVSRASSHVRIFIPVQNINVHGVELFIDNASLGSLEVEMPCSARFNNCNSIYVARWNAELYEYGIHLLELRKNGKTLLRHQFSLDGSFDSSFRSLILRWASAILVLSDFPSVAWGLAYGGLLLCVCLVLPGCIIFRVSSAALLTVSLLLGMGPIIIATRLVEGDYSVGFLSLSGIFLSGQWYPPTVDIPYLTSFRVIWSTLVPASLANFALVRSSIRFSYRRVGSLVMLLFVWRAFAWSFEIWGAYGLYACVLSPACFLTSCVCSLACLEWVHARPSPHNFTTKLHKTD